jgi:hypothetical protein
MVDAINSGAARAGKSVGAFIRDALSQSLGLPSSDFGPARAATNETSTTQVNRTPEAAPQQASGAAPQAPIAGPGALRAAQVDRLPSVVVEPTLAESPVELTHKKTKEDEQTTERRWFNS